VIALGPGFVAGADCHAVIETDRGHRLGRVIYAGSMEFILQPIGVIHSPFMETAGMPIQASRSNARGETEVFPEFVEGLHNLGGFSHILLIYVFHRSEGYRLHVKPFLDIQPRGLFATRYPCSCACGRRMIVV
jgi:hypothetical protein